MDSIMDKMNFTSAMLDVYDVFGKEPNERTTELYFKILQKYNLETVLKSLEITLKKCKYFPKPADIITSIDEYNEGNGSNNPGQLNQEYDSWFNWLMRIPANEAKYYEHKVDGRQREILLSHLRKNGIKNFESIENNPGIGQLTEFIELFQSGKFGQMGNINNMDPELVRDAKEEARQYDRTGYVASFDPGF